MIKAKCYAHHQEIPEEIDGVNLDAKKISSAKVVFNFVCNLNQVK
jgi:hypothetical protein